MSPAALMAGSGGQLGWSGTRGKRKGEFYRRVEAVPPHRHGLQELQHGRRATATCGGANGQWGMAVRPPVSAHRPRSTGLGLHASVTASSAQCHRRGPRTAGFSGASACARGPGTARPTWRHVCDVVRGRADIQAQFHLALFKLHFLQKFKQECSELWIPKLLSKLPSSIMPKAR
jgi:hypothetical protein